jgi:hypothetical protein
LIEMIPPVRSTLLNNAFQPDAHRPFRVRTESVEVVAAKTAAMVAGQQLGVTRDGQLTASNPQIAHPGASAARSGPTRVGTVLAGDDRL